MFDEDLVNDLVAVPDKVATADEVTKGIKVYDLMSIITIREYPDGRKYVIKSKSWVKDQVYKPKPVKKKEQGKESEIQNELVL
jgi:hypothetical protein